MLPQFAKHDWAFALANRLAAVVAPALRPEEVQDLIEEYYRMLLGAAADLDHQAERHRKLLGGG